MPTAYSSVPDAIRSSHFQSTVKRTSRVVWEGCHILAHNLEGGIASDQDWNNLTAKEHLGRVNGME